jgi:hypothetical protein
MKDYKHIKPLTFKNVESYYNFRTIGKTFAVKTSILSNNKHLQDLIQVKSKDKKSKDFENIVEQPIQNPNISVKHLEKKIRRIGCFFSKFEESKSNNSKLTESDEDIDDADNEASSEYTDDSDIDDNSSLNSFSTDQSIDPNNENATSEIQNNNSFTECVAEVYFLGLVDKGRVFEDYSSKNFALFNDSANEVDQANHAVVDQANHDVVDQTSNIRELENNPVNTDHYCTNNFLYFLLKAYLLLE